MAPVTPPTIDDLGVRGSLYLAALLAAKERRLPVAPTRRSSLMIMDLLRDMGLIAVPWPEPRWEIQPQAEDTPIEGLQWRYSWDAYLREGLLIALEEYLHSLPRDDYGLALRAEIWEELVLAEAENFFEWQLTRHQFDPAWAQDLIFAYRDTQPTLSIAQWRYCCWAATRHGASVAQQQRIPDAAAVREATYAELRRRANKVGAGNWPKCAFPPFNPMPESALGQIVTQRLLCSTDFYWNSPLSMDALIMRACERATL